MLIFTILHAMLNSLPRSHEYFWDPNYTGYSGSAQMSTHIGFR